jgi:hypothetical protein
MAKMTFSGFDEFEKEMNKIANNAERLSKTPSVPYSKIFDSAFMRKHTKFSSFKKMMESSNFDCSTQEKFDSIPEEDLDKFIQSVSKYKSFENMFNAASEDYLIKEMGF